MLCTRDSGTPYRFEYSVIAAATSPAAWARAVPALPRLNRIATQRTIALLDIIAPSWVDLSKSPITRNRKGQQASLSAAAIAEFDDPLAANFPRLEPAVKSL